MFLKRSNTTTCSFSVFNQLCNTHDTDWLTDSMLITIINWLISDRISMTRRQTHHRRESYPPTECDNINWIDRVVHFICYLAFVSLWTMLFRTRSSFVLLFVQIVYGLGVWSSIVTVLFDHLSDIARSWAQKTVRRSQIVLTWWWWSIERRRKTCRQQQQL